MTPKKFLRKAPLRNDFIHNSTAKNSRAAVFQESCALNFKLPEFHDNTCILNWLAAVGIFSDFLQVHHSCVLNLSKWISASSWLLPTP